MENSVVLARILGPFFIIVAVSVYFNAATYQNIVAEFSESSALVYFGGIVALVFGLIIVQFHNAWAVQWYLLITVLGWLSILKGAALLIFPSTMKRLSPRYRNHRFVVMVHGTVCLAIGVFLTGMGYW